MGMGACRGTRLLQDDLETPNDIVAKQDAEPRADETRGALDLALPRGILCPHVQHPAFQLDCRHAVNGRTNRRPPGEGDLFRRQRRVAEDDGECAGHDLMNRNHSQRG